MDDLLHRIKGALLEAKQYGAGDWSNLVEQIDKRLNEQDEQLATIRCLKCGHKTSISITIGKPNPPAPPTPRELYGYDVSDHATLAGPDQYHALPPPKKP